VGYASVVSLRVKPKQKLSDGIQESRQIAGVSPLDVASSMRAPSPRAFDPSVADLSFPVANAAVLQNGEFREPCCGQPQQSGS